MPEEFEGALKKFKAAADQPHARLLEINQQMNKLSQERGLLKAAIVEQLRLPEGAANALRASCW